MQPSHLQFQLLFLLKWVALGSQSLILSIMLRLVESSGYSVLLQVNTVALWHGWRLTTMEVSLVVRTVSLQLYEHVLKCFEIVYIAKLVKVISCLEKPFSCFIRALSQSLLWPIFHKERHLFSFEHSFIYLHSLSTYDWIITPLLSNSADKCFCCWCPSSHWGRIWVRIWEHWANGFTIPIPTDWGSWPAVLLQTKQ